MATMALCLDLQRYSTTTRQCLDLLEIQQEVKWKARHILLAQLSLCFISEYPDLFLVFKKKHTLRSLEAAYGLWLQLAQEICDPYLEHFVESDSGVVLSR